jgi:type VI secretion system protein ImpE
MQADEHLRQGNPKAALTQLQEIVRKDPSSSAWRIYLFQLLATQGAWGRAATQLGVLSDMDPANEAMVRTYREALLCEALRAEVFAGNKSPLLFGEPEPWSAWMLQAAALTAQGKLSEAEGLRAQALEEAPAVPGSIDGQPFAWIADADSRLGPLLEAVVLGKYYWVPFSRIKGIVLEKPSDLRDFVWMPAEFLWSNGGKAVGFVPTRYAGSESSEDGLIQLARKTEWVEAGPATWLGQGQRMFTTDAGDFPLCDVRTIELDPPGEGA